MEDTSQHTRRKTISKGAHIGNYEILDTIGEGSFAIVKLAEHRLTKLKVAIKIIDKTKIKDNYELENIYREAQILRILDHPNIIKLFEVMETKNNLLMVLEFAPGGELLDHIVKKSNLSEDEAIEFTRQIVSAMVDFQFMQEHAHSHNIVHRDLKSENLLLDGKGQIKISDFGLSNFFEKGKELVTSCGSPLYSAPEILLGKKYSGPEVDCWSLGIIVYAMVVGDLPYADSNITALFESIMKGRYNLPIHLSSVIKPENRASMAVISGHPWIRQENLFLDDYTEVLHFRPLHEGDVDQQILDHMEQMGLEKKATVYALLNGKFNQAAGVYYQLKYQKMDGIILEDIQIQDDTTASKNFLSSKSIKQELANVLFELQRNDENKDHLVKVKGPSRNPTKKKLSSALPLIPTNTTVISNTPKLQNSTLTQPKVAGLPKIPTKFGILPPKVLTSIPVDKSIYAEDIEPDGGLRTIKFAFNCCCHNQLPVETFYDKISTVLEKNEVIWTVDGCLFQCHKGEIKFEAEICKIPRMPTIGLRMKRNTGEIWEFKELTNTITNDLSEILDG